MLLIRLGYESATDALQEDCAELTAEQKDLEPGEDMLKLGEAKLAEDRAKLGDDQKGTWSFHTWPITRLPTGFF
ncbi:hypothetical protein C8034_v009353 [Colletotrichum sidae]|uniref:Uncharacterized protein n=1 Tax=Colletotrichum sidae TaxID=1347389 RepID=A0A4V3I2V7_9PEZI|nr:hypothetical protein C8034_v009353 [Colletotrichum sidae]